MGTISDKLMRIINTKEDIRKALISKGYDVPTSVPFKEYAKMILDLPCKVDSFPDIEGIVARYSAPGLTNEQMAANPVWVDKTGNGHDLQLKNLAWAGMSRVGGYKYDFLSNDWSADVNQLSVVLSHKIVIINKRTSIQLVKLIRNELENTVNITLKITGLEANGSSFKIYDNVGSSHAQEYNKDGIYQINYTATEGASRIYFYVPGGNMGQLENPITIEQLPLYPGALVFDGVDDYGTCDNFPILTKEKGYTVVALRQWIEEKNDSTALVSNCEKWGKNGAFLFEYNNLRINFLNVAISFGHVSSVDRGKSPFSYQTSKLYNGKNIEPGSFIGSNELVVGKGNKDFSTVYKVAIWELIILDHDATEEELTKIKDYFVKTYPWLFPDQAWTVTGKTNEDEDRATIANITGNGNDLVLSNFGFAEGSGYGLYYQYFGNEFKATNGEIEGGGWNIIDNYNISHDKRIPINSIGKCFWGNKALVNGIKLRFKLTGMTEGDVLAFGYAATYNLTYTSDGIYAIDLPPVDKPYGFSLQSSLTENLPTTPVTIELLPFEYEGYIVTDGVDDKIVSSVFGMGKDFTIVGDWKFIDNKKSGTGLVKGSSFYIYNTMIGLDLYINSGSVKNSLDGIKSINAACSDGRAYDRNWNEILANTGNVVGSGGTLEVSSSGGRFDRIAFKNLAIYPRILSKDDCIKAYNYLQTIKSK